MELGEVPVGGALMTAEQVAAAPPVLEGRTQVTRALLSTLSRCFSSGCSSLSLFPGCFSQVGGLRMLKIFSYGGGVQSTAALVLAAQGRLDYRTFVFCHVGADSENPETLSYVCEVARPFAV